MSGRVRRSSVVWRVMLVAPLVFVLSGCWLEYGGGPAHRGFNPFETKIGVGNVATLTQAWTASIGSSVSSTPSMVNGVLYIADDTELYAFNAAGVTNCTGSPKTCKPLWEGHIGFGASSTPSVVNGVVYVGSNDDKFYAFKASPVLSTCPGTTVKVCPPLWTATTGAQVESSPVVSGGKVFVGSEDHKLYAYDAAGVTNCSGVPKTCQPLWTATTGDVVRSSPSVVGGVVYIGSFDHNVYAYDAAGSTNCSGVPKTCQPLWTGPTGDIVLTSVAVANGVAYAGSFDHKLYAFDAAGATGCSGVPKICQPLWTGATGDVITSSPAVAYGQVYVGSFDSHLYAFDAQGNTGCSGVPKTCAPLWTGATGAAARGNPVVANGVVYVRADQVPFAVANLYAFDANGNTNCSGSPKVCLPVWNPVTGNDANSGLIVSNGAVYFGDADGKLHVYTLP